MSSVMEIGRSAMGIWQRVTFSSLVREASFQFPHLLDGDRSIWSYQPQSSIWNRNKRILHKYFGNCKLLYKCLLLLWLLHCLLDDSFICSGLIEHESRNIVIASKTKQAIRNVIAEALKNLNFLWSRGIIDNHEGIEIKKVIKQFPTLLDSICLILRPAVLL